MYDYTGNEDAGDLGAMGAADQSVCRLFTCPECGHNLGPAEDFDGADDGTAGDCDRCGETLDWSTIDPGWTPPRLAGHRGY